MDEGSAPVFGFPPICYSPTNENVDQNTSVKTKKDYLTTLMRHIFRKNVALPSVGEIIDAKEKEDEFYD